MEKKEKIILLSGAYKNSGDFLIVKRCEELIKNFFLKHEIVIIERNKNLLPYLDLINSSKALILAGGPAYKPNIYPDEIPLIEKLEQIKTKIFALGLGWYGSSDDDKTVYTYKFSMKTLNLFKRIISDTKFLGCRDVYSKVILNNNGLTETILTGCPAWYSLDYINNSEIINKENLKNLQSIKSICISNHAQSSNILQVLELINYIKNKTNANITFVFHRGIQKYNSFFSKNKNKINNFLNILKEKHISIIDISSDYKGMEIYDSCDIHIGYRVHAHIYSLSKRIPSILIEEDGRGAGVNEALSLKKIRAYNYSPIHFENMLFEKIILKINNRYNINKYVIKNVNNYLDELFEENFMQIERAFTNMKYYYNNMNNHLNILKECIENEK
jgi:hypothetical protein